MDNGKWKRFNLLQVYEKIKHASVYNSGVCFEIHTDCGTLQLVKLQVIKVTWSSILVSHKRSCDNECINGIHTFGLKATAKISF